MGNEQSEITCDKPSRRTDDEEKLTQKAKLQNQKPTNSGKTYQKSFGEMTEEEQDAFMDQQSSSNNLNADV